MTHHRNGPVAGKGLAVVACIAGLASLVAFVLFLVLSLGATPLMVAAVLGVVAIVVGVVALRQKQVKGLAITGIITGAFSVAIGAALYIFALIFVGAFGG